MAEDGIIRSISKPFMPEAFPALKSSPLWAYRHLLAIDPMSKC